MAVATLPVKVVQREVYEKSIPEARRRIGRGDPDDVELLALPLHTGVAVWSRGVDWLASGELLARLGSKR